MNHDFYDLIHFRGLGRNTEIFGSNEVILKLSDLYHVDEGLEMTVIAVFWQNVNFQVTTSCTSVYVDGSESRGALAAEIDIKYGAPQYMGRAVFTVWMPETPLNINVADTRLSQIKGWKVPQNHYFQQGEQGTPSSQQQDIPSSHNRGKLNQTAAFHNEVPTANTREQCKYVNWIYFLPHS